MSIPLTAPVPQDDLTHAEVASIQVNGAGAVRGNVTYYFGTDTGEFDRTRDPVTLTLSPQQIIDITAIVLDGGGKPPAAAIALVTP